MLKEVADAEREAAGAVTHVHGDEWRRRAVASALWNEVDEFLDRLRRKLAPELESLAQRELAAGRLGAALAEIELLGRVSCKPSQEAEIGKPLAWTWFGDVRSAGATLAIPVNALSYSAVEPTPLQRFVGSQVKPVKGVEPRNRPSTTRRHGRSTSSGGRPNTARVGPSR